MSGRPASTIRDRRLAELGALAAAIVWGSNFIVVKAAIEVLPPVGMSMLRFSLAAVALLAILHWREGTIRLPLRDLGAMALVGMLGFGVYQVLWTVGLLSITAGDSALLIATTPVITALLAVVAGSDTLTRRKLVGAIVSFVGVAVVITGGQDLALGASVVGALLTLGAALCWAIYTSFGAPILRRHSPLRTTAWAMTAGAIFLVPIGSAQLATLDWSEVTPPIWGAVVYSALLPAAIGNVVVFHAVKLLGPTRITAFQFLVPAFAVLMGAAFLAEPVRLAQLVGGAVIVAGILVTRSAPGWRRGAVVARGRAT
ncbi:MAG TPA: DMT family transporter [Vitreimonas sp.]|nr:DMT family transporter [Vitreimonas sp.]